MKNKVIAYHCKHKLFLLTSGKNAKNITNCIKNSICSSLKKDTSQNTKDAQLIKKNILYNTKINIDNFIILGGTTNGKGKI